MKMTGFENEWNVWNSGCIVWLCSGCSAVIYVNTKTYMYIYIYIATLVKYDGFVSNILGLSNIQGLCMSFHVFV